MKLMEARSVPASGAIIAALLMLGSVGISRGSAPAGPAPADPRVAETPGYITYPDILKSADGAPMLDEAGRPIEIEKGLLFVPENRRNPDSRMIAVHFMRLPASQPGEHELAPVFVLPGGPGSDYAGYFGYRSFDNEVRLLRRYHDVIYMSQRGYPGAPGFTAPLWLTPPPPPLDAESTNESRSRQTAQAFRDAIDEWTHRGVDLAGYDILNIVDDVYDLRAALGYDKIMLRGCSFGSQWSLAYMKRWPETVDRAILSGVEPLDYGYDNPAWLWASMERLAKRAEADPDLAPHIPEGGLIEALRTVIERLEQAPRTLAIRDPATGEAVQVAVGTDDLCRMIADPYAYMNDLARAGYADWPRFILELHAGDYRYLAAYSYDDRTENDPGALIMLLIDNSLGISQARDRRLLAAPEARWLGDINLDYRVTRDLSPTPEVGDEFRAFRSTEIPVLMIQGDLDWSTPLENAQAALPYFENAHLAIVEGGSHCPEIENGEIVRHRPGETAELYGFFDADFAAVPPAQYFERLPGRLILPPLSFAPPGATSLYEEWLANERIGGGTE